MPNPYNGQQVPFQAKCLIDTGFDGGIFLPDSFLSDARSIGVEPSVTTLALADGSQIVAHVCAGYLQEIERHVFALPGIPILVAIYGHDPSEVIGMNTLQHFSILFDGPNQRYTLNA